MDTKDLDSETLIVVRRHWNDIRSASVRFADVNGFRWDQVSGGVQRRSPRPMIYAYMQCTDVQEGELSHSASHGPCPHTIKVVVVARDNSPAVMRALRLLVAPKPN